MANGTPAPAEGQTSGETLQQQLAACQKDRDALQEQVSGLLQSMWTESLRIVEEILKYDPDRSNGDRDRLFQSYKSRVLNEGNKLKRQLPSILGDYLIEQVFTRKVTVIEMPRRPGPLGLPRGVFHPSERKQP